MSASLRNCIVAGLLLAPFVSTYADDGKSRYVSGAGADSGDCLNKFRPCRSLSYAISKAGKGDTIAVAEGRYEVATEQDLTNLLTMQGRVTAGFDRYTGFSDRTAADKTVLVGVPPDLRERFEQAGFTVIVDTKGLFESDATRDARERKTALASKVRATEQSHKAAACTGGSSNGFACQNLSLHAHLAFDQMKPASTAGNDIWGFVDLNTRREYAFMGLNNGVAIVDITNPDVPEQVAFATGTSTTWRDTNVYQRYDAVAKRWRAYAYVTADAVQDFMMVLDLSGLPNSVEKVDFSTDFRSAHNGYLINADYTFGLAETTSTPVLGIAGSSAGTPRGSFRLYSLANPRSPQFVSTTTSGYAHDIASFPLRAARKDTQCVNASGAPACHVLSDFNENTLDIWDITNPASPQMLVSHPYQNARYVHSGWWSEDGRYVFGQDELDERDFGLNTTVRAFDLSNLRAPVLVGTWTGPTQAIDHNGYVRGNRYYFSNYAEGVTVLDITNPASMQRVAYFDTFPTGAQTAFVGAWGVYPFFASGTIAVSDINTGLYLVKNEALSSPNGTLTFGSRTATGAEGQTITIPVTRTGGVTGAVSVNVDLLYGSAGAADASTSTTTLNWADGDAQPKAITLNLATDAQAEDAELLFVRLKNPQGGATVTFPDAAYVYVTDVGATNKLRVLDTDVRADEIRTKALVTVTRTGSLAGAAQLSYRTLPAGTYTGFTAKQGDLSWADGDVDAKVAQIDIDPSRLFEGQTGTFQVEFFAPTNASLESPGGAVSSVIANVTILGEGQAPTPPPPPPTVPINNGGSKGGGAIAWWWVLMLGALAAGRCSSSLQFLRSRTAARDRLRIAITSAE